MTSSKNKNKNLPTKRIDKVFTYTKKDAEESRANGRKERHPAAFRMGKQEWRRFSFSLSV